MNYRTDSPALTLQELKHWIETLPSEANDYEIVLAKFVRQEDNGVLVEFNPIRGVSIYEEEGEILMIP